MYWWDEKRGTWTQLPNGAVFMYGVPNCEVLLVFATKPQPMQIPAVYGRIRSLSYLFLTHLTIHSLANPRYALAGKNGIVPAKLKPTCNGRYHDLSVQNMYVIGARIC
jgi:hypothetical protein